MRFSLAAAAVGGIFIGSLGAQVVRPTLGVDHLTRIQTVLELQEYAQNACKELVVTKNYVAAQKETTGKIEAEYVGWTLDWSKLVLVEKTGGK